MKTENIDLMHMAKDSLKGKWGLAIGTFVVFMLLTAVPHGVTFIGPIVSLIIAGPFAVGLAIFSLAISRNEEARVEQIFHGFKIFGTTLEAYLRIVFQVILWALLFLVPGIMVALSYAMTFYILADNSSITAKEAMQQSKEMMEGYKLKLFYLGLRFFGLALLCILTLGIGFLWLFPYMQISLAKFYDDLKDAPITE